MRLYAPLIFAALAACSTEANHVGNPLLLPFTAVGTGVENAIYDGQRAPVEDFVGEHFDVLVRNIEDGGGNRLDKAFEIAGVPDAKHDDFLEAMEGYDLSKPDNLVVALMVWRD